MRERNKIKIILLTIFLILAVIVIIGMAFLMYKVYNENRVANNHILELEATVNDLKEEMNNNSNTINLNNTETNESDVLSEIEAERILEEKFKIAEEMWLDPLKYFDKSSNLTNVKGGQFSEIINFEETVKKYGTDNFLKEVKNNLPNLFFEDNNRIYAYEGVGGFVKYDGLDKFESIEINDTTIKAILKTKQKTLDGSSVIPIPAGDKSSIFVLVKSGDNWLIDQFNSRDLD